MCIVYVVNKLADGDRLPIEFLDELAFLLLFSPAVQTQNGRTEHDVVLAASFSFTVNETERCGGGMKDAHPSHLKVLEEQRGSPSFLCVVRLLSMKRSSQW